MKILLILSVLMLAISIAVSITSIGNQQRITDDLVLRTNSRVDPRPILVTSWDGAQTIVWSFIELPGGRYRITVREPSMVELLKPDGGLYR